MWPSTQPLRPWARQCQDRDYMDVCSRFAVPGQDYCENHRRQFPVVEGVASIYHRDDNHPPIICLCGSTRFHDTFRDVGFDLTLAGIIVLSIGINTKDSTVFAHPETDQGKHQKQILDWLHQRKVDLCNEILVLNVDGYIGDSTRAEVRYALSINKPVKWLYPDLR